MLELCEWISSYSNFRFLWFSLNWIQVKQNKHKFSVFQFSHFQYSKKERNKKKNDCKYNNGQIACIKETKISCIKWNVNEVEVILPMILLGRVWSVEGGLKKGEVMEMGGLLKNREGFEEMREGLTTWSGGRWWVNAMDAMLVLNFSECGEEWWTRFQWVPRVSFYQFCCLRKIYNDFC